jgi:hypothetical protein
MSTRTLPLLFTLGRIVATPGAMELIHRLDLSPGLMLSRHSSGDWGDLHAEDWHSNNLALQYGDRLFSCYGHGAERIWIITEADRSSTCLMRPEDY